MKRVWRQPKLITLDSPINEQQRYWRQMNAESDSSSGKRGTSWWYMSARRTRKQSWDLGSLKLGSVNKRPYSWEQFSATIAFRTNPLLELSYRSSGKTSSNLMASQWGLIRQQTESPASLIQVISHLIINATSHKLIAHQNYHMSLNPSFTRSQPRYRSVKYKLLRASSQLQSTTGPSLFKPSRHSFSKMVQPLEAYRTDSLPRNPEEQEPRSFARLSFFEKNRMKESRKDIRSELSDMNKSHTARDRVQLPALQEGDSYFTVLDNINLPIEYLKGEIIKATKGLTEQVPKMQQIREDMKKFRRVKEQQLKQIQQLGVNTFKRLRNALHVDQASQQNHSLRMKREVIQCSEYLPGLKEDLEVTKERLRSLQAQIFSNKPFELSFREDLQEEAQPVYF